jgi:hypothetical protein
MPQVQGSFRARAEGQRRLTRACGKVESLS